MTNRELIKIYNDWKIKALNHGFSFEDFWNEVCYFTDPQDSDAASWAIAGKCAFNSLIENLNEGW